jgi:hypothetical protein
MPKHIRSDNVAEFAASVLGAWLAKVSVGTLYIEPGLVHPVRFHDSEANLGSARLKFKLALTSRIEP